MRNRILLTLLLGAIGAAAAPTINAQEWTLEQQGLIDHVEACWDAWVDALADETPSEWEEACPSDEQAHYWWSNEGSPSMREDVRRNWHATREAHLDWVSLRPIYVDIFGDVGVIHLYGLWRENAADGTIMVTEARRTEVFQRRGNDWVFVGGQGRVMEPDRQ